MSINSCIAAINFFKVGTRPTPSLVVSKLFKTQARLYIAKTPATGPSSLGLAHVLLQPWLLDVQGRQMLKIICTGSHLGLYFLILDRLVCKIIRSLIAKR